MNAHSALLVLLLGAVGLPMASSFLPIAPHASASLHLRALFGSTCKPLQPVLFQTSLRSNIDPLTVLVVLSVYLSVMQSEMRSCLRWRSLCIRAVC